MRILIVDGDGAAHLQERLQCLGYAVCGAVACGRRAVAEARRTRPDVALVDLGLSGELTGPETAQRIGDRFDVPVIFLADGADGAAGDPWQRAAAGDPFGFVLRPFDDRQLRLIIETALVRHARERARRAIEITLRQEIGRLQRHTSLLQAVLDSMSEGVVAIDADRVPLFHNAGALWLGLGAGDSSGSAHRDMARTARRGSSRRNAARRGG